MIISVAFIVGAPRLSLALLTFPCPPYPAFNTGQLFSIYSPILQLLESGEKVKFLSPNRHQCGTPRGRRFANKPKQKPNTQHYTTRTTTHNNTQQHTHNNVHRATQTGDAQRHKQKHKHLIARTIVAPTELEPDLVVP